MTDSANLSLELSNRIRQADRLPSLPAVAIQVLAMIQQPDCSFDDLVEVIQNDPALTARILKVINSPLFGMGRAVTSLKSAATFLGMRRLRILALSFSVVDMLRHHDGSNSFDYCNYWRHSLTHAVAARLVAQYTNKSLADEAFVVGLLSDIGLLAAHECGSDLMTPLLDCWQEQGYWSLESERRVFGCTHAWFSAEVLNVWGLPESVVQVVRSHHGDDLDQCDAEYSELLSIVRSGAEIALVFCGDLPCQAIDECKACCRTLVTIDKESLENLLDEIATRVIQTASLFSVHVGETRSYEQLLAEAQEQLLPLCGEESETGIEDFLTWPQTTKSHTAVDEGSSTGSVERHSSRRIPKPKKTKNAKGRKGSSDPSGDTLAA